MSLIITQTDKFVLVSMGAGLLGGLISILLRPGYLARVANSSGSFKVRFIEPVLLSCALGLLYGVMTFSYISIAPNSSLLEEFSPIKLFALYFVTTSAESFFGGVYRAWKSIRLKRIEPK